jgi:hypothetical protein
MERIEFKEFIRKGFFGRITIGTAKRDIVKFLGKPSDSFGDQETQTLKYGQYEFFYWTGSEKVLGIQNDHLQADCINHSEQINFKNERWTLDKWFLTENKNTTLGQVSDSLKKENIPFDIEHAQDGVVIKCLDSNVTFDFVSEFRIVELEGKGIFRNWVLITENKEENFVLNGVRLFDLTRK